MAPISSQGIGFAPFRAIDIHASTAGFALDLLAVATRLWVRTTKNRRIAIGDYMIIIALALAFARLCIDLVINGWVEPSENHVLFVIPQHTIESLNLSSVNSVLWLASTTFVRLSILFVYLEVFYIQTWLVRCAWFMIGFCIFLFLGNTAWALSICSTFALPDIESPPSGFSRTCGVMQTMAFTISTVIDLVVDIVLVIMPLCVIWDLKITRLKKAGVSVMFCAGFCLAVVAAMRIYIFDYLVKKDVETVHNLAFLNPLELHLGILCACLPFLGAPIGKLGSLLPSIRRGQQEPREFDFVVPLARCDNTDRKNPPSGPHYGTGDCAT